MCTAQVHYLLEQLVVLIESSSSNQVQLCKHRVIRVLLNEFQEVLKVMHEPAPRSRAVPSGRCFMRGAVTALMRMRWCECAF